MSEGAPVASAAAQARGSATTLAVFLGLAALSFWLYWGLWNNQWYQDDWQWLRIARDIARSPGFLFTPDLHNSEAVLRFTQRVVMALTFTVAELQAGAYHVVSIVLHAAAATAVYRLLRVLLRRFSSEPASAGWAVLGAVVFAGSSNHAMAVLWVSAQSTLLATIAACVLLTVWMEREQHHLRTSTWALTGGLFLVALYSKNTVVTVPGAMAATLLLLPPAASRPAWKLVGALAALAAVHLAVTKFLLPLTWGLQTSITDQGQFGLSLTTARNALGALLGGFVSARTYQTLGIPLPFELVSAGLAALLLGLAGWLGVLRPAAVGLLWIVILALPTCVLDYVQYDPTQLTVNRYQHLPLVGAAWVTVLLARAAWHRRGRRRVVVGLVVTLAVLHLGFHRGMLQSDQGVLRTWGDTEMSFIEHTLARAESSMPPGTTIYAVRWKTGDAHLAGIDALVFRERGYTFAGQQAFEEFRADPQVDPARPPWVAAYDPVGRQFGVMPLTRYLQLSESRAGGDR